MNKQTSPLNTAFYWAINFLLPVLAAALIGTIIKFIFNIENSIIIFASVMGAIAGLFTAEYMRRIYGKGFFWKKIPEPPK